MPPADPSGPVGCYGESAYESANGGRLVTTATNSQLYRQSVAYKIDSNGELVPVAPPTAEIPARGEARLYRQLAGLASATDAEIAAAATRFGPLGPLRPITLSDPARYLYFLDWAIRNERRHFKDLRRWLASGSVLPIPARLAPLATLIVAFADADPDVSALLAEVFEALAEGGPVGARSAGPELVARLMGYQFRLSTNVDIPPPTANEWISQPDALVPVRVAPGSAAQLPVAANLVLSVLEMIERDGGVSALLDPSELGRFAAEVAPYHAARIFRLAPPETLDTWRLAARELADWTSAVRDLRILRAAPTRRRVSPPISALRAYGGVGEAEVAEEIDDERALSAELSALLALRLQQIGAWPYPAEALVGTFGRALWSLWRPIKASAPPRRCAWPGKCSTVLSESSHGNRRYCEYHRRMAARDRAARSRARQRGLAG
jgi:hypothetical protein